MKIKLRQPWWSAYQTFGWTNGQWGIGLNARNVEQAIDAGELLEVTVGDYGKFVFNPAEVKDYAVKYKTTYTAKHNTILYVVPNDFRKAN